jgi:hypothetical protein
MSTSQARSVQTVVVVAINVAIAGVHFITGPQYRGPFPAFVNGHLLNILIPFGLYLLLGLNPSGPLRHWPVRAALVFGAASAVEIAQGFGLPLLGSTFDPVDFAMYGLGTGLAALLDGVVFPRLPGFREKPADAAS